MQIVGYGMTGVVPKPGGKFSSVDDYYRDMRAFTRDYFDGRLFPEHRDIAEIELEMSVGDKRITITRGFVESESLRSLKVITGEITNEYADLSPEERHSTYELLLTEGIGLGSFRELVFVQSFVLTFDERRHLLFWDSKVLETACLFLSASTRTREPKQSSYVANPKDSHRVYVICLMTSNKPRTAWLIFKPCSRDSERTEMIARLTKNMKS